MQLLIIALATLVCTQSRCQSTKSADELIIGKWVGAKKETKFGRDTLNNGEKMLELSIFRFKEGGAVTDLSNTPHPQEFNYNIQGEILSLGKLYFKIEKLTDTELILLDYDPRDPESPLTFRHYFTRELL